MSIIDDRVHVSLETADGGVVVLRKRATGPGSGRRLTREGALLEAAHHPGIVQVVRRSGEGATTEVDLAWAGSRSLASQPRLPIAEVAGLATSLATTVADLHDLGIVHGRIVAEHVLIGVDGRPVLCGFSEAVMPGLDGGCDATPGDDVAALGALISWLAGAESEVEPIPEHRWWGGRRWDGYHRRALLNLADHAAEADPDRRPSARALADAITTAVPSARLPTDRHPISPVPVDHAAARPESGRLETPGSALGTPAGAQGPVARAREPGTVAARPLNEPTPAQGRPARSLGRTRRTSDSDGSCASTTSSRPTAPTDRGDGDVASPGVTSLPVVGRPDGFGAGGSVGSEPDPVDSRPAPARRRLALGGVAAGLVLVSVLAMSVLTDGGDGKATNEPPAPAATNGVADRRPSGGRRCPTVVGPRADVDGDGCTELVVAEGRRVRAGTRSFLVGEAGDRVTIGDWDCDGIATPAVLRPATGAIYTFAGWPERGALPPATLVASVERATDIHGRTGPSPGCPVLVIDRRDRPARVLDLGAGR